MSRDRVGLVTTTYDLGPLVAPFLEHHRSLGVERFYVFVDGPDGGASSHCLGRDVELRRAGDALRRDWAACESHARFGPWIDSTVMARQQLNADLALRAARRDGLDWLLHLDTDELVVADDGDLPAFLASVPAEIEQVRLLNQEIAPTAERCDEPFGTIAMFKTNPLFLPDRYLERHFHAPTGRRFFFLGYVNGKSAVRVTEDALPAFGGVHGFQIGARKPRTQVSATGVYLRHYINFDLAAYVTKYRIRRTFPDTYFGDRPIEVEFHLASRDLANQDESQLAEFFRRHALYLDEGEKAALLDCGLLIEDPAFLARSRQVFTTNPPGPVLDSGPRPLTQSE